MISLPGARNAGTVVIALACILLTSCGGPSADGKRLADGSRLLRFAGSCYRIPAWNARMINGSAGFPFTESRKSTRSLTLRFSNAEIRARIPGYEIPLIVTGQPLEGELVSFYAPSPPELEQIRRNQQAMRGQHYALWYAEGNWTQRTIEPAPVPGLFRVAFIPGANSWQVVSRIPDMQTRDTHLARDFWVSACYSREPPGNTSCLLKLEQGDIFMDTHTTEPNLPYREQLKRYYLEKLESWKAPCGGL